MARAQLDQDWYEPQGQQNPSDWQALRADLVHLLDQVEGRVSQSQQPYDDSGWEAQQPRPRQRPNRRQEALQSVTHTLERFSNRDVGQDDAADNVQSAIAQIRQRHGQIHQGRNQEHNNAPNARAGAEFSDFGVAVDGITNRLGQLEHGLRGEQQSATSLQNISDQVGQLTRVVELLAGAVGETGQVKRLESQIANIARMVGEAPQGDSSEIGNRLDRLTGTIERLTDLQQHASDYPSTQIEEISAAQVQGLNSIEDGVRNVYDRIDLIEQNLALSPSDIERLTQEMAAITQEMANVTQVVKAGDGSSANTVLTRIDALNARVGQIEGRGNSDAIGGLQADIGVLRDAVSSALDPRLKAIKTQLENLDQKFSAAKSADISVVQLETQIRQLIARMDQTGEQLSDITRLYMDNAERGGGPDVEALAELVARRTSEEVSRTGSQNHGFSQASLDELESRMARLFAQNSPNSNPGDFSDVQEGIRQVDERLARLEGTLNGTPRQPVSPAPVPAAAPTPPQQSAEPALQPTPSPAKNRPARSDEMSRNPLDDMPLVDPGFAQEAPQPAQAKKPRRPHDSGRDTGDAPKAPVKPKAKPHPSASTPRFSSENVERPAKPQSSFSEDAQNPFNAAPASAESKSIQLDASGNVTGGSVASSSRNTFIEAARKAAQRQDEETAQDTDQSLIARAFARFQKNSETPASGDASEVEDAKTSKARIKAEKKARAKLKAEARAKSKTADPEAETDLPYGMDELAADPREDNEAPKESFLLRHRRPILLAATLVAVCLLALNLVEKRIGGTDASISDTPPASTTSNSTMEAPAANSPILDTEPTGSINPNARITPRMEPIASSQIVPQLLGTTDDLTVGALSNPPSTPELRTSAIKLELPPEVIGPLPLRQAAANGNPQAQFEIAAIYSEGQALDQDLTSAAKWFERAAAQGFAPAEYRLGTLYERGQGVDKDLIQAKLWYQRAAEAGNRMAMHNLAALYASGELGEQQFSLAAEWFERAASRGLVDSQFNLGMLYARGLGLPQNMPASYKWFSLAASQGDEDALKARDDVARSLDAETMSRLQFEIANWKRAQTDMRANFAPIGTWAEDFDPGQEIRNKAIVEKVQAALNRLGYNVGVPDGLMGPRTSDAIKDFERATGMSESGAINPRLLAVLGSQPV